MTNEGKYKHLSFMGSWKIDTRHKTVTITYQITEERTAMEQISLPFLLHVLKTFPKS
jgi:hypothetical protein